MKRLILTSLLALLSIPVFSRTDTEAAWRPAQGISTFSIVARDPVSGELGVAVASRFFAVGSVVPWARAGAGAVATQASGNTSFGPRGLDLMERGLNPEEAIRVLLRGDEDASHRQIGLVARDGTSATWTGTACLPWAGGRSGPNYAIQGNILAGEGVMIAMEKVFLESQGPLALRLVAALTAGDRAGGDARGHQSAALLVVRESGGYGGYNDRTVDVRVDDHADPIGEIGRLARLAVMNADWNQGWTLFLKKRPAEALVPMERAAAMAPANPEVLYDLAVIRLAAGRRKEAMDALKGALERNPGLRTQAAADADLAAFRGDATFESLIGK